MTIPFNHFRLSSIIAALAIALLLSSADPFFSQSAPAAGVSQTLPRPAVPAPQQVAPRPAAVPPSYDTLFEQAKGQLESKQALQAQAIAEQAIRMDGERYEAHVIAAAALRDQKEYDKALAHLQTALALATQTEKQDIQRAITEVRLAALPADAHRKLDALMLVIDDVNRATNSDQRTRLLREFMIRSNAFLEDYPFVAELWLLRAAASIELNYPEMAWIAKSQLDRLGMSDSDDPAFRRIMAQLERKQWLDKMPGATEHLADWPFSVEVSDAVKRKAILMRSEAEAGNAVGQLALCEEAFQKASPLEESTLDSQGAGWCRKAADQGSAIAASNLAYLYEWPRSGIATDAKEALRWYQRSANLGFVEGQYRLAQRYESIDPASALRWYRIVAAQDYGPALDADLRLARIYRKGLGVSPDDQEANRRYHAAGQRALKQDSAYRPIFLNEVAIVFAADPDPKFRDGPEALKLALTACQLNGFRFENFMETLAAAYAETGDWSNAVATQQKALDMIRREPKLDAKYIADQENRLQLYMNKQPYRKPTEE